jgi:hypothetical protein
MPLILGANSVSGGYEVDNSLRFNGGSSDYLNRTLGTSTSRRIYTMSAWVKRSKLDVYAHIFTFGPNPGSWDSLRFDNNNKLAMRINDDTYVLQTSQLFRDVSAWYHIVVAIDTTQATASNRVRMYVNGSEITSFGTSSYPTQNYDTAFTSSNDFRIGLPTWNTSQNIDSYLSEAFFIDGQALTPSSFGETDFDTGIWKPKAYTGSFGTNGFYLQFKNSASLGTDSSGNGNTFTVNNLTSVDQSTDTPTNNFATLNSLNVPASNQPTFSEGNLKSTSSTAVSGSFGGSSSIGVSKGKWYVEAKAGALASSNVMNIGVTYNPSETARTNNDNKENYEYTYNGSNGYKSNNSTDTAYGSSYTTGDIIGIALDLDNNKIWWSKNGTFQNSGDPVAGTGQAFTLTSGETYFFYQQDETGASSNTSTFEFNFGSPIYSANSYTDGAGYGNFSYAVPSGYYSLCTKNLATFG